MNAQRLTFSALRHGQRSVITHYAPVKVDCGASTAADDTDNPLAAVPATSALHGIFGSRRDSVTNPFSFSLNLPGGGLGVDQHYLKHGVLNSQNILDFAKLSVDDGPKRKFGFAFPRPKVSTRDGSVQTCSDLVPSPEEDAKRRLESFPRDMENQIGAELLAQGYKDEAFQRFEAAAKKGSLEAVHNLGVCYSQGHGVKADAKKAFKIWDYGAKYSESSCLYQLAVCHLRGLGTTKDAVAGRSCMNMAAMQGSPEALYYKALQEIKTAKWEELPRTLKPLLKHEKQRTQVCAWLKKKGFPDKARPIVTTALAAHETPF
ncbi:hypothetical protein L596_024995 [Steinernema carpocapsae]|uniref:Uncharacterized protein n=1 Tax=Steinernema carpocapsae TaxID=34508 RepID=A0A4U5M6H5_STECR|nr:hypothetical protein L596_024995 [Steinernema carpocapsae]